MQLSLFSTPAKSANESIADSVAIFLIGGEQPDAVDGAGLESFDSRLARTSRELKLAETASGQSPRMKTHQLENETDTSTLLASSFSVTISPSRLQSVLPVAKRNQDLVGGETPDAVDFPVEARDADLRAAAGRDVPSAEEDPLVSRWNSFGASQLSVSSISQEQVASLESDDDFAVSEAMNWNATVEMVRESVLASREMPNQHGLTRPADPVAGNAASLTMQQEIIDPTKPSSVRFVPKADTISMAVVGTTSVDDNLRFESADKPELADRPQQIERSPSETVKTIVLERSVSEFRRTALQKPAGERVSSAQALEETLAEQLASEQMAAERMEKNPLTYARTDVNLVGKTNRLVAPAVSEAEFVDASLSPDKSQPVFAKTASANVAPASLLQPPQERGLPPNGYLESLDLRTQFHTEQTRPVAEKTPGVKSSGSESNVSRPNNSDIESIDPAGMKTDAEASPQFGADHSMPTKPVGQNRATNSVFERTTSADANWPAHMPRMARQTVAFSARVTQRTSPLVESSQLINPAGLALSGSNAEITFAFEKNVSSAVADSVFDQITHALEDAYARQLSLSPEKLRIQLQPESLGAVEIVFRDDGASRTTEIIVADEAIKQIVALRIESLQESLRQHGFEQVRIEFVGGESHSHLPNDSGAEHTAHSPGRKLPTARLAESNEAIPTVEYDRDHINVLA